MPPKRADSARWKKKRKERKKETKPRKPRAPSTKPRKKREVFYVPICPPHDPVALAGMRKTCSPVLRSTRLVDFSNAEMEEYARCANINVRTARRDAGKRDKRPLDRKQRLLVLAKWAALCYEKGGTDDGHADCTQSKFRDELAFEHGIVMSRHQLQRLLDRDGVKKPAGPERVHMNCMEFAEQMRRKRLAEEHLASQAGN